MTKISSVIQVYVYQRHLEIIKQILEEDGHTNFSRTICAIISMVGDLRKANDLYQKALYKKDEELKASEIKLQIKVDECVEFRDKNIKLEIDLQVLRGKK